MNKTFSVVALAAIAQAKSHHENALRL